MVVNDNAGCLDAHIVLAFFASRLAPTGSTHFFVGAGLLAVDVNDNAGCLNARIARAFVASGLAPTGSTQFLVGAGLPAIDVNDNAGCLDARIVRALFASRVMRRECIYCFRNTATGLSSRKAWQVLISLLVALL